MKITIKTFADKGVDSQLKSIGFRSFEREDYMNYPGFEKQTLILDEDFNNTTDSEFMSIAYVPSSGKFFLDYSNNSVDRGKLSRYELIESKDDPIHSIKSLLSSKKSILKLIRKDPKNKALLKEYLLKYEK